jgi:hypothetical protein
MVSEYVGGKCLVVTTVTLAPRPNGRPGQTKVGGREFAVGRKKPSGYFTIESISHYSVLNETKTCAGAVPARQCQKARHPLEYMRTPARTLRTENNLKEAPLD